MTTRTIVASSMQQAMQQAKNEFGDAAIILKSCRVGDLFEVTVTDDANCLAGPDSDSSAATPVDEQVSTAPDADVRPEVLAKKAAPAVESKPPQTVVNYSGAKEPALQKLMTQLRSMEDHWANLGGQVNGDNVISPSIARAALQERFLSLRLEKSISDELLQLFAEIPDVDRAWKLVIKKLQTQLTHSKVDIVNNGGAYVFVGPSGAGKTATIGKLAAEHVLLHGAENIALLTTDTYRIGACQQLLKLGQVMKIEVAIVDAPREDLAGALARLSNKTTVLVDTAGLGSDDADLAGQLADIRRQGERLSSLLVLPSNMQFASMQAAYDNYYVQPYAGCVFTKLDECNSLGAGVSLALENDLPLAYVTRGHAIPEALSHADGTTLVRDLLSFAGCELGVPRSEAAHWNAFLPPLAQQLQLGL